MRRGVGSFKKPKDAVFLSNLYVSYDKQITKAWSKADQSTETGIYV